MGKEKIRHLFKKNHIEIFKVENPEFPICKWPAYEHISTTLRSYSRYRGWGNSKDEYKLVKKESPLGFYYTKKVKVNQFYSDMPEGSGVSRTIVTFPVPGEENTLYQLKYVTQYADNKIGNESELRPWDIYPGDKDFPDTMLNALVKEVNSFFDLAEAYKIKKFELNPLHHYYSDNRNSKCELNTVKREVFKELFGNEKGPRFQTNEEKILAHGFDLKYSFRKDKEKK